MLCSINTIIVEIGEEDSFFPPDTKDYVVRNRMYVHVPFFKLRLT